MISKNRWFFQYPTLLFNIEKEIVTNRSKMDEAPSTGQYYWKVSRTTKSTFAIQLWLCKNKVNSRQRLHQDLSIICTFQNVWNLTYKKYWNHKFWKVQLLTGCLFFNTIHFLCPWNSWHLFWNLKCHNLWIESTLDFLFSSSG